MRELVIAHALLAPRPQRISEAIVRLCTLRASHKSSNATVVIDPHTYYRHVGDRRVLTQHLLHIQGRDPQPRYLEHVVVAGYIPVGSVLAPLDAISRNKPLSPHRALRQLTLMPVEGGARLTSYLEDAVCRSFELPASIVEEPQVISGHRTPHRA